MSAILGCGARVCLLIRSFSRPTEAAASPVFFPLNEPGGAPRKQQQIRNS